MINLAVDCIALTCQGLRSEVSVVAFANLAINAIAEAATLGAIRNIANVTGPPHITLTDIGSCGETMLTWWIAYRDIARSSFVTIETPAIFRSTTYSEFAKRAYSNTANRPSPPCLTLALVWSNACSKNTWWLTHGSVTVYSCPPIVTLTALSLILVVCQEALGKVVEAICSLQCI